MSNRASEISNLTLRLLMLRMIAEFGERRHKLVIDTFVGQEFIVEMVADFGHTRGDVDLGE